MRGRREKFTCPSCGVVFAYFVQEGTLQPKVKCSFCRKESFPHGEPPPAPAKPAAPKPEAPKPAAPEPDASAPVN